MPFIDTSARATRNERTEDREATAHASWYGHVGNQFWLVAEHGMKAGYVRNIERDPRVRLKLRDGLRTCCHAGTAHLLSDDDPRERQRWLARELPSSAGNARAVRLFGTQLLTVRIDLDSKYAGGQSKPLMARADQLTSTGTS
jgi:hypothetical protein